MEWGRRQAVWPTLADHLAPPDGRPAETATEDWWAYTVPTPLPWSRITALP